MCLHTPDLSIVIPVLNEALTLPSLFDALECQRGLGFEIIFSVAPSTDGSEQLIARYAENSPHKVVVVPSRDGRARQMNCGAQSATGKLLLFLHADSYWTPRYLLRDAVDSYRKVLDTSRRDRVAAHFRICFTHHGRAGRFYRYLSEKSALNLRGTIYGDQGMMMDRDLWYAAGMFREDVNSLEDLFFADSISQKASWTLLPQVIKTSSRRYQRDGVVARLTMNALLLIVAGGGLLKIPSTMAAPKYFTGPGAEQSVCGLLSDIKLSIDRLTIGEYFAFWSGCAHAIIEYSWLPWYACSWLIPAVNAQQRRAIATCYINTLVPLLRNSVFYGIIAGSCWLLFYLVYLVFLFPGFMASLVEFGVEPHHHN